MRRRAQTKEEKQAIVRAEAAKKEREEAAKGLRILRLFKAKSFAHLPRPPKEDSDGFRSHRDFHYNGQEPEEFGYLKARTLTDYRTAVYKQSKTEPLVKEELPRTRKATNNSILEETERVVSVSDSFSQDYNPLIENIAPATDFPWKIAPVSRNYHHQTTRSVSHIKRGSYDYMSVHPEMPRPALAPLKVQRKYLYRDFRDILKDIHSGVSVVIP